MSKDVFEVLGKLEGKVDLLHEDVRRIDTELQDIFKQILTSNGELGKLKVAFDNHLLHHKEQIEKFYKTSKLVLGIAGLIAGIISLVISVL